MDVTKLEPADRDPKKLRATALKIVIFMVASGLFLQFAYNRYQKRTSQSDRPSLETKITETEVELLTADGIVRNFQDLKGGVTLALTLTKEIQEESAPSLKALKAVMEHFQEGPNKPTILVFVLDGENVAPQKISHVLSEYGQEPQVLRVVASDRSKQSIRAFTKTRLRFNQMPEQRETGEFEYDTRLVLIDQHLHVRGIPGSNEGWNFAAVAKMEKAFAQAKESHPEEELIVPPMTSDKLIQLLIDSIQYLYDHPNEKAQK